MSREQWGNGYARGLKEGIRARASFKTYVVAMYDGNDSPKGDFAYDIKRDTEFPEKPLPFVNPDTGKPFTLLETMSDHLIYMGACNEATEVFQELYNEWVSYKCD